MNLSLLFAASLATALAMWYVCGWIPERVPRGLMRATAIALLCSPGILIGHGFAVVPSLFALYVQPSIFTLGAMLVMEMLLLGVIFCIPALREQRSAWPPKAEDFFLSAYPVKFVCFGLIAAMLLSALHSRTLWEMVLQYGVFFAGIAINLTLCLWASRNKGAWPWGVPAAFAVPVILTAGPVVPVIWYVGGAIGGLIGCGRRRPAAWMTFAVFAFLIANALWRTYLAATAAPHVTIQGGVAGNAVMAVFYGIAGTVVWQWLNLPKLADLGGHADSS